MNRDFMDGVWRKVELLEKSDALLSIERTRTRAKARVRPKVVLAAAMLMAFFLGTAAASTDLFEQFRIWMGGFEEGYQAQKDSAIDQGIEISPIAVLCDSTKVEVLMAIRDLEGDRIGEDMAIEVEMEPEAGEHVGLVSQMQYCMDYNEAEKMVIMRYVYECDTTYPVEKSQMHVLAVSERKSIENGMISLEDPPQQGSTLSNTGGIRFMGMGFEEDGMFHIRFEYPQETGDSYVLFWDCFNDSGEEYRVEHGEWSDDETKADFIIPELTKENIGGVKEIDFRGWYNANIISGEWVLPIQVKLPAECVYYPKNAVVEEEQIKRITVSGLSVQMETTKPDNGNKRMFSDDFSDDVLTVCLKDGKEIELDSAGMGGGFTNDGYQKNTYKWDFEFLMTPEEVGSIILRGVEIPLE